MSLVITVLNEAGSIFELLESVCGQRRLPDEVVLVDGGSSDETLGLAGGFATRLPLRVLRAPGSTIAAGRNHGIAAARGEIIAVTDAGARLTPGWLEALAEPLERGDVEVASGFFAAGARSFFETVLGAATLPLEDEIDPARFLPSSRSAAFTRRAWETAGGYPEWLDYGEDLVFDLRLRRAGCRFAWVPQALVHFRPRPDLEAFLLQYYRYARGDGKADLWRGRHAARYGAYLALFLALAVPVRPVWVWLLFLTGGTLYMRRPLVRLLRVTRGLPPRERVGALALLPLLRAAGDAAKMVGYPVGVWWRLRRRRRSAP